MRHVAFGKGENVRSLAVILSEMEETSRRSSGDAEIAHSRADDLLVETIRVLASRLEPSQRGQAENIVQHFYECHKWYA